MVKITFANMKAMAGGAVGQVFCSGINRYVVVAETPEGISAMCLWGTVIGDPDEIVLGNNEMEIFLEDKEYYKRKSPDRWAEIATKYPAIG